MEKVPRWLRWTVGGLVGSAVLLVLVLATFPWGLLRDRVSQNLARRFGGDVTIGSIERVERFSFAPTLIVRDFRIAQPAFAGPGDLVRLDRVDLRFRVLPLLLGRTDVSAIGVEDGRVALVRTADGRENWNPGGRRDRGGSTSDVRSLAVRGLRVEYRDAVQNRRFAVTVTSDARGFRAAGDGAIDRRPVRVALIGPAIRGGGPWPFRARVDGPTITVDARGTMRAPLDTDRMTVDIDARADDLKTLDALIEAGLFGTQPIRLSGRIRHAEPDWIVERLSGTVGGSRLRSAEMTVAKRGEDTRIDGRMRFATLDFADLATDEGRARAAAERRLSGPRLFPATRVNLSKLSAIDGDLTVRVDRLASDGPSALRSLDATLALADRRLTVKPLTIALSEGRLAGEVVVDQRDRPSPRVAVRMDLSGARISTFAGGSPVDAALVGRVRLSGTGDTLRTAMARADGHVALYGHGGTLPARLASLLGADVARGVLTDEDARADLRCLGLRLRFRSGLATAGPLLVDTSRAQTRGQGTVRLTDDTLALALTGAPKQRSVLRLDEPVRVTGSLHDPQVRIPLGVRSAGGILSMLGRAIGGRQAPVAGSADCGALRRQVMG